MSLLMRAVFSEEWDLERV